jgi:ribose transport system substrate-binding protein
MFRSQLKLVSACVAMGLVLALAIAGCGGGGESSSTVAETTGGAGNEGGSSGHSVLAKAESELAELYKGENGKPEAKAPEHKPGENVWVVSSGYAAEAEKIEAEEFKAAAESLGWNVTLKDGKFDPSVQLGAIREAVRAGADAIWLPTIDCEPVKAGLLEAKQAGIVVVSTNATDCEPALFSGETNYEVGDHEAYLRRFGEIQAIWAIAKTKAEAKVLLVYESDLQATKELNNASKARFEECATCEIVGEVSFTGSELGPPLQQKVEQALLKYPAVDVINGNYDGAVETSVAPAVRSSGKEIAVLGGEGVAGNIELIRNGEQAMAVGYPLGWPAYAAVDAMVRLLAGEAEAGNSGAGFQVVDAEHNLPPKGEPFRPSVNFQQLYKEAWGV